MTDQELIAYFDNVTLPETLRINRAITQFNVKEAVDRNIEMMRNDPKNGHARHRLIQIMDAIGNPYDGPEIPKV
ncbi:MAG: hypothetical protein JWR09_2581 [Mucilaginibacter sp.]|nr:hypothetical protein [Mucilaginibacter sp.]